VGLAGPRSSKEERFERPPIHSLSAAPSGLVSRSVPFPGVDLTDVYELLERQLE
jgi:hypothetical protein